MKFTGDGFIISLRHTDAIYKIDRASGAIKWKLGGTRRPESLTLVGDPFNGISGQHDARLIADGVVSIYDNGTRGLGPARPPRRVVYRINPFDRTATRIEDLRDSAVGSSACCGSTRRLPGGNRITGWGGTNLIMEHRPDGRRIFTLKVSGLVYRGIPIPAGPHKIWELRAGMDAMQPARDVPRDIEWPKTALRELNAAKE